MCDMSNTNPNEQGAFVSGRETAGLRADSLHLTEPITPRHRRLPTPLGEMVIAVGDLDGRPVLTGVWFHDQKHFPERNVLGDSDDDADPLLSEAALQIAQWFAGERRDFELPLALESSPQGLRPRVWRALQEIPYGQTSTYGSIAADLGGSGLAQAVGQAVGRNPWSVVVPCHRVLGADGSMTGYAGGVDRKRALLDLEGAVPREPELF